MRQFADIAIQRMILALWSMAWLAVAAAMLAPLPEALPVGSDKLMHALGYAAMTLLAALAVRRLPTFVGLAALTLALATGFEFAQLLTPWRSFEILDLMMNAGGVAAGTLGGLAWLCLARPLLLPSDA